MTDFNCLLAGLTRLLTPLVLLIFWHKKKGARIYPALVALLICFPVFPIGAAIRSGFSNDNPIAYYIQQGLLFGFLEEGAKYLGFRFLLENYDNRKDAVTYGIGHCAYEEFGGGLACLFLIGSDNVSPDIFWHNLWTAIEGAALVIALTVLIFYGIYMEKSKVMLPAAMFLHALSNAFAGIFFFSAPIVIIVKTLLTAGICYAAYRCCQKMRTPYEDEA